MPVSSSDPATLAHGEPLGLVHVTAHAGHHEAYQRFLGDLFGLAPSTGKMDVARFRALVAAPHVLFASLDDDVGGFVAVSLARALLGRHTAGLFLHPADCTQPGMKGRIKAALFGMLRRVPRLSVLSILPFDLLPQTQNYVSGWIHDPQLWDQIDDPIAPDAEFVRMLTDRAAGRKILAYLGWATAEKDFPHLARILATSPHLADNILPVAVGRVAPACRSAADGFVAAGGMLIDRFVSDAEISAAYDCADLIWVCYAPGYEQASGIFGRAVQLGRPVVIRQDSRTIRWYCDQLGHPFIALPPQPEAGGVQLLHHFADGGGLAGQRVAQPQALRQWKDMAVKRIAMSLGKAVQARDMSAATENPGH